MFASSAFWLLISFVLFFTFMGKPLWKMLASFLDERSERIAQDLKEAQELRNKAQTHLNEMRNMHMQAETRAKSILEHAKLEAERMRSESGKELDDFMRTKESLIDQRIRFAEKEAISEIKKTAVKLAIEASEKLLENIVTEKTDKKIIEKTMTELAEKKVKSA